MFFWIQLLQDILLLDIVYGETNVVYTDNFVLFNGQIKGNIFFIIEIIGYKITLTFRESAAEETITSKGRRVSIRDQENKMIRVIGRLLKKKKIFLSYREAESLTLFFKQERQIFWNL